VLPPADGAVILQHATMYQRFRLTPRNARAAIIFGGIIPYAAYQLCLFTDVSHSR
jgi:hypothetical protein